MNLKSQIHRISCFPYRHEGRSQEILLALRAFLLPSQNVSPFPLSHIGRYTPYRHFERSEKSSLHSVVSCSFRRKVFPFSAVSHTTLSPPARKIPRLRSGWRYGSGAFQTYSLYATWNKPIPPHRHFERSEKSSLHSALSCSFRKRFPLFRCRT